MKGTTIRARVACDSGRAKNYFSPVARFAGFASYTGDPGVPLRSTPGRGPRPSISAGVLDFMPTPGSAGSDVVVHRKLEGMGSHAHRLNFALAFVVEPAFDHSLREHITLEQKLVIVLQRIERFIERTRQTRHVFQLFRRQVIDVLVERRSGIDSVLDPIDSGHDHRGKSQVRIA